MKDSPARPLDHFLHPYMFVLKEGNEITDDFLDYSLLLLKVGQADVLPSPSNSKTSQNPTLPLVKR